MYYEEELKMVKKFKLSILLVLTSLCLFLTFYINIYQGKEIVYTHIYYIPIVLAGIWFYRKAFYIAFLLGLVHLGANYWLVKAMTLSPVLRVICFITMAGIVGSISERNDYLKNQLKRINSAMLDFVLEVDGEGVINYISPSVKHTLGYSYKECIGKSIYHNLHSEDMEKVRLAMIESYKTGKNFRIEYRCKHAIGEYVWVESIVNTIKNTNNDIKHIFGSRDVSYRKKNDEQITYMVYHDQLTGIYNRRFFEEKLSEYNHEKYFPVGLIICDIDGLKIVNDNLGHKKGDELIIAAAQIIKNSARLQDSVCRVGGDEFAILMPVTNEKEIQDICDSIRKNAVKFFISSKKGDFAVVISIGYSLKKSMNMSLNNFYIKADNNMYLQKNENRKMIREIYRHLESGI